MLWLFFVALAFVIGTVSSCLDSYPTYEQMVLKLFYRIQEKFPELKKLRCEVYVGGSGVRLDAPGTKSLKAALQNLGTVRELAALLSEHLIISDLDFTFGTCLGVGIVRISGYDYLGQNHEFIINPLYSRIEVR